MKQTLYTFLRRLRHLLLMLTAAFPLAVLLAGAIDPQALPLLPLEALVTALFAGACLLIPGRWRLPAAAAGCAGILLLGVLTLPLGQRMMLILLPCLWCAVLLAALPVAGWRRGDELHVAWYAGGVALHVVAQLASDHAARGGSATFAPADPWRMAAFFLFLGLLLLAANRMSLHTAAHGRVKVPDGMRRQNVVLTMALMAAAVLLAAAPAVGRMLAALWQGFLRLLAAVAAWVTSLLSPAEVAAGGGASGGHMPEALAAEAVEQSLPAQVLEYVVMGMGVLGAAVLAVLLGRKLARVCRRLLAQCWRRLSAFGSAAAKDCVDEITDTRDDARHGSTRPRRLAGRLPRVDERRLSPGERVRYRYLRLRMKNGWPRAATARETLPDAAACLYERARYGGEELTPQEAAQFREDVRSLW